METVNTNMQVVAMERDDKSPAPKEVMEFQNHEMTDSGIKGENLQQMSTNALPPYSPASLPNFLNKELPPPELHCCTDCGDSFISKSSLSFHLTRRSVLIKFPCDTCKYIHIFYNHCMLQSHIRSHSDNNEKADISRATINPLPRIFMDGIQSEFAKTLDDELNNIDYNEATTPSELLEFSIRESDTEISPIKEKQATNDLVFVLNTPKVKCLDCNSEFDSFKERQDHITNNEKIPSIVSQCEKCLMVCPSKCSLKAHQRIHLQISPYVCPECGDSPDPHWTNFLKHVNLKCFHNARSIGFKCPLCKRVAPNNDALLKHMELHTVKYLKCECCPKAFVGKAAFNQHFVSCHESESRLKYTLIYKCSLCDVVFLSYEQLKTHRSAHLKEQTCEYVFSCLQCGKILEGKDFLLEHIKSTHPKIYKQIQQLESSVARQDNPIAYKGKVECMLCRCIFYSNQGYKMHASTVHININQQCGLCFALMPSRKDMLKHGKQHFGKGYALCLLCNNKPFVDEKTLDAHLLTHHVERLRFCTFCPACNEILPDHDEALNHLREEHQLKKPEQNFTYDKSICCHFCRLVFATDILLRDHLRKEHNVKNSLLEKRLPQDDLRNSLQPKKLRIEGNACAKCDFVVSNRDEFKKHILSHKSNKSSFQCQECGLCFIVEPSLAKHLKIVHKINDPKSYISKEGTNFSPDIENTTEVISRNSLECSVCYTTFPSESSLKIHMRSHGMAFIQTKTSFSL